MLFRLLLRLQIFLICLIALFVLGTRIVGNTIPRSIIVYMGADQHGTDIYLLDVNSRIRYRLGISLPGPAVPRLSPNGQQIAFSSEDTVYVVDIYGEHLQSLAKYSPDCTEHNPNWSADGQQIVYVSECNNQHTIQVIALEDQEIVRASKELGLVWLVDWSPDGQQFVFSGMDGEIHIYDVQGQMYQLTSNVVTDYAPTWSPDGKQIAFVSVDAYGIYRVELIDADGSGQHALIEGFTPRWSPDGSQIVFTNDFINVNGRIKSQIFRMNADGSGLQQLTFQGDNYNPDW